MSEDPMLKQRAEDKRVCWYSLCVVPNDSLHACALLVQLLHLRCMTQVDVHPSQHQVHVCIKQLGCAYLRHNFVLLDPIKTCQMLIVMILMYCDNPSCGSIALTELALNGLSDE